MFAGMPFTADLQNGFFYIGHQLVYLLSGGNLSVHLLQVFLVVHYFIAMVGACLLYTSDAADERSSVDLGGRRIIKKKHTCKSGVRALIHDKKK